jgi:hypothetical protein
MPKQVPDSNYAALRMALHQGGSYERWRFSDRDVANMDTEVNSESDRKTMDEAKTEES